MAHTDILGTKQDRKAGTPPDVLPTVTLIQLLFDPKHPDRGTMNRAISNFEHAGELTTDEGLALLRFFDLKSHEAIRQLRIAFKSMASAQIASESRSKGKGTNARA